MGAIFRPTYPEVQRCHPLSYGLYASWAFAQGGGPVLKDRTGNGNDASLAGTPTWVGGRAGYSISTSTSNYISLPMPAIGAGTRYTVSAWLYPITGSGFTALFDSATRNWASFFDIATGAHTFGNNALLGGYSGLTANAWHQIVWSMAITPNNCWVYVDGVQKNFIGSNAGAISAETVVIGANPSGGGAGFGGYVDDVRIWLGRQLSESEIQLLYAISGAP